MIVLLLFWVLLLVLLVVFVIGRLGRCGALTLAYFLGLSLIHVPGVLPFLGSDPGLIDEEETQLGFEMTILGMVAFVSGAVLARRMDRRRASAAAASKRGRAHALQRLGWRAVALGVIGYFVLIPLSFRVASLTALVSPLGTLLILGFWLLLYGAAEAADRRMMLAALAPLPLLPLITLVAGGFLGVGIYWILSVVAFLFVIARRRVWFYVAALPVMFLGLSLFVTYMGQRADIRELAWQEHAGLLARLDRVSQIITEFQLIDFASPTQGAVLDSRLNQNWLVGAAIRYHEDGGAAFAYGGTVPPWTLIPRAVWPDKPATAGGNDITSEFTGIRFDEATSVGAGQVLEFYINFGIPGVLTGFFGLAYLLMRLDQGMMRSLAADDMRGVLLRAMPGMMLLQPGGFLREIVVSCVAAYFTARLVILLKFFAIPQTARLRRQPA